MPGRPLSEIAAEIVSAWGDKMPDIVRPPLDKMRTLRNVYDDLYIPAACLAIADFLGTAKTWRGAKAREIKGELKNLLTSFKRP